MSHLDDDTKMIADIRVLHSKITELHSGVNALRKRYPDQDLIRYAEIDQVRDDAEKLRQVYTWLQVIADALNDRVLSHQKKVASKKTQTMVHLQGSDPQTSQLFCISRSSDHRL